MRRLLAGLAAATLLAAAPARAADPDARLLMSSGDVRVIRTDRGWTAMQPLARGDALRAGDTIVTGDDGRVQIRFSDGALVTLQPRSRFRIDEYRFDARGQRSFMSLLRGALRTTTGAIGKRSHEDYRLSTPTATVGIRGTDYAAEETVCDPRCAPGASAGLRVTVNEGRVVVTSRAGSVEVGAGASVLVGAPNALPRLDGASRPAGAARPGASATRAPAGGAGPAPPAGAPATGEAPVLPPAPTRPP